MKDQLLTLAECCGVGDIPEPVGRQVALLTGYAVHFGTSASAAWLSFPKEKGFVTVVPPEPGVHWKATPAEALAAALRERAEQISGVAS